MSEEVSDNRFQWLIWLSLGEIGMMLVFSNYSALLPVLQKEWALSNGEAGWIYSSYQIGYILSVVALTSLTDYANTKHIYMLSACWSGISGILFSLLSEGFKSALVLRALMGIGLAGTYMPGLRMVSEKFPSRERGKAVGIYVAAFSLGVAASLFLTGFLNSYLSWQWAFFLTSMGPIGGGIIAFFKLGKLTFEGVERRKKTSLKEVFRNRPVFLLIIGYTAHMWEMFGMRAWMVAFFTACLITAGYDFGRALSLSAIIAGIITLGGAFSNALGGALSDRFGRRNTIMVVLTGSSLLSLLIGWTRTFPLPVVLSLSLLYGFMVTGESSVLSTGVTELAHPGGLGRTMALQSLLGFGAASLSPIAFGYILDLANPGDAMIRLGYIPNWGFGFTLLGVGGLIGPLAVWRMKKEGASV